MLVTQRHHQLQCYRECVTTTSCEAFTETNTQCSLYDTTVEDADVEASTDIDLYVMGKKVDVIVKEDASVFRKCNINNIGKD